MFYFLMFQLKTSSATKNESLKVSLKDVSALKQHFNYTLDLSNYGFDNHISLQVRILKAVCHCYKNGYYYSF